MTNPSHIQAFFDEPTFTVTYLVGDPVTRQAAVIDSVLDFDPASGKVSTGSAEAILAAAKAGGVASLSRLALYGMVRRVPRDRGDGAAA